VAGPNNPFPITGLIRDDNVKENLHRASLAFGKHVDKPLPEVPTPYLLWALKTLKLSSGLRTAVREELKTRPDSPPDLPPDPLPAPPRCPRCGSDELLVTWQALGDGRRAIRGECRHCRCFVAFLPQTKVNVALANGATRA
jgi:hypothetical protein